MSLVYIQLSKRELTGMPLGLLLHPKDSLKVAHYSDVDLILSKELDLPSTSIAYAAPISEYGTGLYTTDIMH